MIEQPARRGDDDVDARLERALLRGVADAAEHRRPREPRVLREGDELLVDLRRELAGGREDERPRRAARLRQQAVEHGEEEGGRLAAAGHRGGEEVATGEAGGDRLLLDGRRAFEAEVGDALEQQRVEVEILEIQ